MRSLITFCLLAGVYGASRAFFRFHGRWIGGKPENPWKDLRVLVLLNHTSLYEPVLAGFGDLRLMWRLARHGVLPVADKTMRRAIGVFFRFLVRHVVVVTRQRDTSWEDFLRNVDDRSLVAITPEGRMKRPGGLDSHGRPMTVRGGIADILEALPDGRMLAVYSGGLHHIQAPGERLPRLFRTIRARLEVFDIAEYKAEMKTRGDDFRRAVIDDLTRRRDQYAPEDETW